MEKREGKIALSRGYTRFQEEDVLFAKITPCMQNGKCAIAKGLRNGFGYGSTEYHVLRCDKTKVLPDYLHALLRTKKLRQKAQIYFTGSAGQQRVGKEFLEGLTLPEIPISSKNRDEVTQEKIIDHMAQLSEQVKVLRLEAEKLRRAARQEFEEEVFGREKKEKEIGK